MIYGRQQRVIDCDITSRDRQCIDVLFSKVWPADLLVSTDGPPCRMLRRRPVGRRTVCQDPSSDQSKCRYRNLATFSEPDKESKPADQESKESLNLGGS